MHEKALDIRQNYLSSKHPDVARSYGNIGLVYEAMGGYTKALSSFYKVQEIFETSLSPTHPHIAQAKWDIERVIRNL